MPCFRGIDVYVGTNSWPKKLPEFPHPDSSSIRLLLPADSRDSTKPRPRPSIPSFATEPDLTRVPRANPLISVYIPSLPGTKFWIQYAVARLPKPPCHLYFKMFMNGHNMTSWGINPASTTTGTVAKALYEPDDRWQCRDERGVAFKPEGIETRFFQFHSGPEKPSFAEDGGLIEVQVFRAKGRKRRPYQLKQHSSQEKYGICTPSGGLIDHPEDTTYYDWLLIDPKESPYATFRFHYRSWSSLKLLNIVKPTKSPSSFSFLSLATTNENSDDTSGDDEGGKALEIEKSQPQKLGSCSLTKPPEIFPAKSDSSVSQIVHPSKIIRDSPVNNDLNRPLPPLPTRPTRRSSPSSEASSLGAISLTPSLAGVVGDDACDGDGDVECEVEYGAATKVAVHKGSPKLVNARGARTESPTSDYENSPPSSTGSKPSPDRAAERYKATNGKCLERQLESFSPLRQSEGAAEWVANEKSDSVPPEAGTLTLSESEWMRSTTIQLSRQTGRPAGTEATTSASSPQPNHQVDSQPRSPRFPPPRGLLGTDLTRIPLMGPSGDLMKKLRSEDPFKR